MTICIAALYEQNEGIVAISDRMLTAGDIEFEQDSLKMEMLGKNCIALLAGSALVPTDVFRQLPTKVKKQGGSIDTVVDSLKDAFVKVRTKRIDERVFRPRNLSIQDFRTKRDQIGSELYFMLEGSLTDSDSRLSVYIIVATHDADGAHICYIQDPGTSDPFDAIGFCTIGSGEDHAINAFVRANYTKNMAFEQVLYLIYEAKRKAEVAPGVGRQCDIVVVDSRGVQTLDDEVLTSLEEVYSKKDDLEKKNSQEIKPLVDELKRFKKARGSK